MEYSDEFIEKTEWLKTLNEEEFNDELNKMSDDELFVLLSYYTQQHLGKEFLLSEEGEKREIDKLLKTTREPDGE